MLQNEWKKKRISKLIDVLYFLAPRLQHCYWHRSPLQPERISAHIFCVIFDTIQRTKVGSATDGCPLPNDDRYRMSKRTFLSGCRSFSKVARQNDVLEFRIEEFVFFVQFAERIRLPFFELDIMYIV